MIASENRPAGRPALGPARTQHVKTRRRDEPQRAGTRQRPDVKKVRRQAAAVLADSWLKEKAAPEGAAFVLVPMTYVCGPVPTSTAVTAPRQLSSCLARLKSQAHRCETTGDIEPGAAFDADRLKGDRIAGATNQHVGTDADADGNACGSTAIGAGQRPWR